jgi:hypothetical protein
MSFCKRWCLIWYKNIRAICAFFMFILYNRYLVLSCGCPSSHIRNLVIITRFFRTILISNHCFINSIIFFKNLKFYIFICFLFLKLQFIFILRDFERNSFHLIFIFLGDIIQFYGRKHSLLLLIIFIFTKLFVLWFFDFII